MEKKTLKLISRGREVSPDTTVQWKKSSERISVQIIGREDDIGWGMANDKIKEVMYIITTDYNIIKEIQPQITNLKV